MSSRIQKWGNSLGVRIPKSVLDLVRFSENENVEVIPDDSQIIIKRAKNRVSLEERFRNYNGDYQCYECDTGNSVGKEVF